MLSAKTTMVSGRMGILLCGIGLLFFGMAYEALPKSACDFSAPAGWNQKTTQWGGTCRGGRAEGLGVLKEYDEKKVKRFFFGRLKNGDIEFGVIDQDEGFMAGSFANGDLIPSDDRQTFISAFAEAEKAASQVATRFSQAGNKASARFYEQKAKELREQMD